MVKKTKDLVEMTNYRDGIARHPRTGVQYHAVTVDDKDFFIDPRNISEERVYHLDSEGETGNVFVRDVTGEYPYRTILAKYREDSDTSPVDDGTGDDKRIRSVWSSVGDVKW